MGFQLPLVIAATSSSRVDCGWWKFVIKASITLKDLLLHQAGLYPYLKFYESLLNKDGSFIAGLVSNTKDNAHPSFITPNKWLVENWKDTIQNQILRSPVTASGKYVYSDNDFILLGKIIEEVTGKDLNTYTREQFYAPLGMSSTGYLPLQKTSKDNIAATEIDNYFRNQ